MFAQLGVIPRARDKFAEIVAAAECHKAVVSNMPSCNNMP